MEQRHYKPPKISIDFFGNDVMVVSFAENEGDIGVSYGDIFDD